MRSFLLRGGLLACLALVLSGSTGAVTTAQIAANVRRAASTQRAATTERTAPVAAIAVTAAGQVPVFQRDFPDPSVIAVGGRYYAFATETAWEPRGHVFPVLVSADLTSWTYVADVFSAPPAWGRGDWWAPSVVVRGHQYFLYYSGRAPSGMHCLAVATANAPAGPYTDHGPIACQDGSRAIGYIDAWPLIAGGRAYVYFSVDGPNHHSISVLPLSADMLSAAGPRAELLEVTQPWERLGFSTVEGPSVFAWGSQFVMLYSGGSWRGQYGMGFAVAPSPVGPFVKTQLPLLRSGGGLAGPGGGSFFLDAHGRPWLAFHGWRDGGRELYVSPLSIS